MDFLKKRKFWCGFLHCTVNTLHLLCTYPSLYSYIKRLETILCIGDERRVGRLFYTTVHYLMMGQMGPKHVAICLLKHYGNCKEECPFVGLRCNILVWSGRNLPRFYLHFQDLPLCALPLPLPPFILQNSKILLTKKAKVICPLSYPENDKLSPEILLKFLPDFMASHSRRQSVFSKCLSIFGAVCTNSPNGSALFQT